MKKELNCITPFLSDDDFIRGEIPMTKQEVREVSICKLHLTENSVLYDIGCGTGSISVEAARLSDKIKVYALDSNPSAADLTNQNAAKFGLKNIFVSKATAPEGLENLPKADCAFIGGTKGRVKEILESLYKINPCMRIVSNAVTLETLGQVQSALKEFCIKNFEFIQISVARAEKAGEYNLLKAQNPVFIFSFDFSDKPEEVS